MATSTDDLLNFIPLFEDDYFRAAESMYLSTGEYLPQMTELVDAIARSNLAVEGFNWIPWSDEAAVFMRDPVRIASVDYETLRKLFTVVLHADQFNKELLPFLVSKGTVHHMLLRLRVLSS